MSLAIEASRPRLAFAGLGWVGRHRMNAVAASGLANITAFCDPVTESVAEAGKLVPEASTVEQFEQLLDSAADAIVIATPSALHAEQAIAALNRGKAVFCQKPVGRNAWETRRVVDAARRNDLLLGIDFSYRHTAAVRAVHELVTSHGIGDVFAVDLKFHNAYGPDKRWFFDPALSGGGCVIDLGIHLADLALWTLGFPKVTRVDASMYSGGTREYDRTRAVEDFATARVELDSGATLRLDCSWNLPAGQECVIEATFYGTSGAASFRNVNGSFYDFVADHYQGTQSTRLVEPPDEWGGRAIVDWTAKLASSRQFDPEIAHAIEVASLLDAIYSSADAGGR